MVKGVLTCWLSWSWHRGFSVSLHCCHLLETECLEQPCVNETKYLGTAQTFTSTFCPLEVKSVKTKCVIDMPALILHYIRKTWGVLGSQVVSCVWVCVSEWYWIRADNFLLVQLAWVPGDDMIVGTWVRSCWNSSIFYRSWRSNGSNQGFSTHSLLPLYFGFALHTVLLSASFVSSETRSLTICAHRPKSVTFKAAELPCSGIMISSSILIQRQSGLVPLNHCIFAVGVGGQRCPHMLTQLKLTPWF